MLSFHNDPQIKNQLIANLEEHKRLDHFMKGDYWNEEDQEGCAVGCTLVNFGENPNNHSAYEKLFGIPRVIARLVDGVFEGLSVDDSKWWPLAFSEAVPVGKDLSMVTSKFLVWLLEDVKRCALEDGKKAIDAVIELYKRKIDGENVNIEEWKVARSDAAAAAADDAVAAVARQKSRKNQALKLIEILENE